MSDMIRGLPAHKAAAELATLSQTASRTVRQAVIAAIAAAGEQGLDRNSLFISQITIDEGPKLRRFIPMSRGRSQRIVKKMSHITVSLTDEAVVIASGKAYKKELAPAAKPAQSSKKSEKLTKKTEEPAEQIDTAPTEVTSAQVSTEAATETTAEGSK